MMSPRILLAFATLAGLPAVPALANTPDGGPGADAPAARPDLETVLDRPVKPMTSEKANLATLFYTIGRSYGVTITVDPKITGTALLHFNGGTLRQLLQTLLDTNDLFMETQGGVLAIKRTKNEFYFIEYPEISRSASASTSVSLSPSQGTTNGGFTGIGGQAMLPNSGQAGRERPAGARQFRQHVLFDIGKERGLILERDRKRHQGAEAGRGEDFFQPVQRDHLHRDNAPPARILEPIHPAPERADQRPGAD